MATTYMKELGGYVADVPSLWFRRCDGKIFNFDELTQASVSPQINTIDINAGWSLYPVATLPGQSTLDMQFTSGKFQPELFSMTNAVDFEEDDDYIVYETNRKYVTVATPGTDDGTIELTFGDGDKAELAKDANTNEYIISIPGLELDSTASAVPSAGKFTVTESSGTFTVNIYKDDAVDADNKPIQMEVQFARVQAARVAEIDNKASAVGEAMLKYPKHIWGFAA